MLIIPDYTKELTTKTYLMLFLYAQLHEEESLRSISDAVLDEDLGQSLGLERWIIMYTPKYFKVTDFDEISAFIQENSFGTIVTTKQGKPIATHLPLELHKQGADYYITGHMAYANPQWKTFEDNNDNVLVMYQGPHAYISSSWYKSENVPTWNYQSVHVYGTASIMSELELQEDLILLLQKYEHHRMNAALWENLSPQTKKQIRGIVGFKIKIQEVQAAYKLSQNRNAEDYQNIVNKLYEEKDMNSQQMAQLMERNLKRDK